MFKLEIDGIADFNTFVNIIRSNDDNAKITELTEKLKATTTKLETAVKEGEKNGESGSE